MLVHVAVMSLNKMLIITTWALQLSAFEPLRDVANDIIVLGTMAQENVVAECLFHICLIHFPSLFGLRRLFDCIVDRANDG